MLGLGPLKSLSLSLQIVSEMLEISSGIEEELSILREIPEQKLLSSDSLIFNLPFSIRSKFLTLKLMIQSESTCLHMGFSRLPFIPSICIIRRSVHSPSDTHSPP